MTKRNKRSATEEELRLWRHAVREARPLQALKPDPKPAGVGLSHKATAGSTKPLNGASSGLVSQAEPGAGTTKHQATPGASGPPTGAASVSKQSTKTTPPPHTGFDRRTEQRIRRGKLEIHRKIDLHGLRRDEARRRLLSFLADCHRKRQRVALVITGKGLSKRAEDESWADWRPEIGVLRQELPRWLSQPEFRHLVSGFDTAHPKHGGSGAWYVFVRRG